MPQESTNDAADRDDADLGTLGGIRLPKKRMTANDGGYQWHEPRV